MLESGIALQEAMQMCEEAPGMANETSLRFDIYNALSDVCFKYTVEKGLGPVGKEEVEAALNFFLKQFFDDDFEESEE